MYAAPPQSRVLPEDVGSASAQHALQRLALAHLQNSPEQLVFKPLRRKRSTVPISPESAMLLISALAFLLLFMWQNGSLQPLVRNIERSFSQFAVVSESVLRRLLSDLASS
jgi:hypothetical protein